MIKRLSRWEFSVVLGLLSLWAASVSSAADPSSGKVAIQATSVAAGGGVQGGDGTLTYNGKQYPFSLQGLEVVGVGYAEVKAEGEVANLPKLSDFAGVYGSAEASATAGTGPTTVTLKNPKGVTIVLHAIQDGVKLTLAAGGVNVDLKE